MLRLTSTRFFRPALAAAALAATGAATVSYTSFESKPRVARADALSEQVQPAARAGEPLSHLPTFAASEVRRRDGKQSKQIWVGYGDGVYDVTDFISVHPGGNMIVQAAGGPLEPFWRLYKQHDEEWVLELLEEMRVGNLKRDETWEKDMKRMVGGDVYANEPERDDRLIVQSRKPFNAEPSLELLVQDQVTPNELFYVRNHMPVPIINESEYQLEIVNIDGGLLGTFSLEDLKKLPKYEVAATVQCAGNRRNELDRVKRVKGGRWEGGAIGNAVWGGARLSDVIALAKGELEKAEHVCFEGLDVDPRSRVGYGASIPVDVVRRVPDVLLAYEMNGEVLPKDHGYPVRAVVPGVVGARCVKWVGKVVLSKEESDSHWQQQDYRSFSPDIDWSNVDFSKAPSIQEMPVVSAICSRRVSDGVVEMSGYAWSGDGKGIIRVDVSTDGGRTWSAADLRAKEERRNSTYDWTLWDAKVSIPANGKVELVCKAIDSAYNTQPENAASIWNLRGLLNNAWHRVDVES